MPKFIKLINHSIMILIVKIFNNKRRSQSQYMTINCHICQFLVVCIYVEDVYKHQSQSWDLSRSYGIKTDVCIHPPHTIIKTSKNWQLWQFIVKYFDRWCREDIRKMEFVNWRQDRDEWKRESRGAFIVFGLCSHRRRREEKEEKKKN